MKFKVGDLIVVDDESAHWKTHHHLPIQIGLVLKIDHFIYFDQTKFILAYWASGYQYAVHPDDIKPLESKNEI